jgi:hypothetical protein
LASFWSTPILSDFKQAYGYDVGSGEHGEPSEVVVVVVAAEEEEEEEKEEEEETLRDGVAVEDKLGGAYTLVILLSNSFSTVERSERVLSSFT